jgi:hypothetical protein
MKLGLITSRKVMSQLTVYVSIAVSTVLAVSLAALPGCTEKPRETEAPGPVAFAPAAPVEGASVSLRGRLDASTPSRIAVDVVARGAGEVHGAAFRVTWDPEALVFVEARSGAPWSKTALALAKEGSPGQLAVAWAEKGETGIDATSGSILGTLVFDVKGRQGTALGFQTERSQLVDKKGVPIQTRWLGESLAPR